MIALPSRKLKSRRNVFRFEERIIRKNLFTARAGSQQIENIFDPDS